MTLYCSKIHIKIKWILLTVTFLSLVQITHSQQLLIDSLTQRKNNFESSENFVKTDTNYIKTLSILARSYLYLDNDSTNAIALRALNLSNPINYEKGIAGAKLALGTTKFFEGEFDSGFKSVKEAKAIAERIRADTIYLKALNAIGMGHFMKNDLAKGYQICQLGRRKAKELHVDDMQVTFNMNIATSFAIINDAEQALPYYEACLSLLKTKNDELGLAQVKSNMGYLFIKTGELIKSRKSLQESLAFFKKTINKPWQAFVQINLGELLIREKKYDSAITILHDTKKLLKNVFDPQRKAETCLGLSEAYLLNGELDKSEENALRADSISNSTKFYAGLIRANDILYQINKTKKNTEKAITYLETSRHLSDSIEVAESRTRFLMLEAQTNFEQEQSRIEADSKKKLARQKAITYIAIILLISTSFILFLIRKNISTQKKANKELIRINQIKDKVFSIVGHDLKAPINTLQELLELYKNEAVTADEIAKITPRLKNNVDHSAFTLNNLLLWAQNQMNGITVQSEKVNLKKTATEIVSLYHEQIEGKNISINCQTPIDVDALMDPEHLRIVLRNIILNAIKYSKKGGKINFNSEENNNQIVFSVCDNGIGMTQDLVNMINNGENPISKPGTNNEKGTGLGLNICKDLLAANNGELAIESEINKGSSFYISLPKFKEK